MTRFNGQDPRKRKSRHVIAEVLTCLVMGMLAGRSTQKHALQWCGNHLETIRESLPLKYGVASPSTACRILSWVDEDDLECVLMEWVNTLVSTAGAFISVDGKGLCAGAKKMEGERTPYLLNITDTDTTLCMGAIRIGEKGSEKAAFHKLLGMVSVDGSLVTADAIATDQYIMSEIIACAGDFIFQVKKNNPEMYRELFELMGQLTDQVDKSRETGKAVCPAYREAAESYTHFSDMEQNRGRMEYRECWATNDVSILTSTQDRHQYLGTIGIIEQVRIPLVRSPDGTDITPGKEEFLRNGISGRRAPKAGDGIDDDIQRVGIISSQVLTAEELLEKKRKYWIVENGLHYILDNTLMEDRDRSTVNRNRMAILRRFAFNLIRIAQIRGHPKRSSRDICYYFCDHPEMNVKMIATGIQSFY